MILQNVVARFQVVRISVERGKRNYVRSLTQSAVARTDEKAAGESAFEVKATALVAGNQAHGDAATALQVGDHAAIRAANWLKVSAQYSHLNAQTTWPFGKELKANRAAQHLMFGLTQTKEISVADKLRPVHRRGGKIKAFEKRHRDRDPAAGKTIDELTLGAVREVAYIVFDLPGLKVNQIAGQVHLWCVVAQSSKPQRCVLKAGAREIK